MSTIQGSPCIHSPELSNASIVNCLTGHLIMFVAAFYLRSRRSAV